MRRTGRLESHPYRVSLTVGRMVRPYAVAGCRNEQVGKPIEVIVAGCKGFLLAGC